MKFVFTKLASDPLNVNTPALPNPPWGIGGGVAAPFTIVGNVCQCGAGLGGANFYNGINWPKDVWASIKVKTFNGDNSGATDVGFTLRSSTNSVLTNAGYDFIMDQDGPGTFSLFIVRIPAFIFLVTIPGIPFVSNAVFLGAAIKNKLYAFYNGILIGSAQDSTYPSGKYLGLVGEDSTAITDVQFTDFEGGSAEISEGETILWYDRDTKVSQNRFDSPTDGEEEPILAYEFNTTLTRQRIPYP